MKKNEFINIFEVIESNEKKFHYLKYDFFKDLIIDEKTFPFKEIEQIEFPKITSNEVTYIILPRSYCIEKQVSIPSVDPKEISQMINVHVVKLFPLSPDEFLSFFEIIEQKEDGFSKIMLYIIPKNNLTDTLDALINMEFIPEEIIIRPALISKYLFPETNLKNINRYIQFIENEIEIGIVNDNKLLYSRSINLKNQKITDNESLLIEIDNSFIYASNKYNLNVSESSFVIQDNDASNKFISQTLSFEPFPLDLKNMIIKINKDDKRKHFFIDALYNQKKDKAFYTFSYRLITFIFIIILFIFINLKIYEYKLNVNLDKITQNINEIKDKAEWSKNLNEKMTIFSRHFSESENIILSVIELYKLLPDYVTLSLFHINNSQEIILKGISKKPIIEVMKKLENSSIFKNVLLKYQNKINAMNEIDFHITCELE